MFVGEVEVGIIRFMADSRATEIATRMFMKIRISETNAVSPSCLKMKYYSFYGNKSKLLLFEALRKRLFLANL